MSDYIALYTSYFDKAQIKYAVVENILWREYQRMIMPVGPVYSNYNISKEGIRKLFKLFPAAVMCRWTGPEQTQVNQQAFYAVVCKTYTPLGKLTSKRRHEISKGLNNCRAEIIDPIDYADQAYEVYKKAVKKYKKRPVSVDEFNSQFYIYSGYEEIIQYWGVFYGTQMVAFAKVLLFDKKEANISVARFDPAFLQYYPSYALFHKINEYYLELKGFDYVNDGFKSIYHDTYIQKFLINKFGFEQYPLVLHIRCKPYVSLFLRLSIPFRSLFEKIKPELKAFYQLIRISQKS